jgi:antirestriction protein ArdC
MTASEASERIAAAFEAGVSPWSRWDRRLRLAWGLPVDALTGKPIRGVNTWLLELAAIERGYRNPYWATRRQWWELGADVVRHEGTPVLADDEDGWTCGGRLLFNVEQVEVRPGAPVTSLDRFWIAPRRANYALAQQLVQATGALIVTGNASYYYRLGDFDWIEMPPAPRVIHLSKYCSFLFHELVHWVVLGPGRLCWEGDPIQGELIAEMGAAILTDHCGIPMRCDTVDYRRQLLGDLVAGWVAGIRGDPTYLAHACEVAWRAADFVLAMSEKGVKA